MQSRPDIHCPYTSDARAILELLGYTQHLGCGGVGHTYRALSCETRTAYDHSVHRMSTRKSSLEAVINLEAAFW